MSATTALPDTATSVVPTIRSLPRRTMSITQTYYLAHKARAKLSSEAGRADHNLRLLVGHANLLDTLMLELADAEREQESWFNQSVQGAKTTSTTPTTTTDRHVQWADAVEPEEPEEDWQADDSDMSSDASSDYSDDDEYDEEEDSESSAEAQDDDCEMVDAPLRRVASHNAYEEVVVDKPATDNDSDVEVDDDEDDYAQLSLTRSSSHVSSPTSPPELVMEEDSDVSSEDEALPPSPPIVTLGTFSKKAAIAKAQQQQQHDQKQDGHDRLYLPPRNPARLVSNISVY